MNGAWAVFGSALLVVTFWVPLAVQAGGVEERVVTLEVDVSGIQIKVAGIPDRVTRLEALINTLDPTLAARVAAIEQQLATTVADLTFRVAEFDRLVSELGTQVSQLQNRVEVFDTRITETDARVAGLQTQVAGFDNRLTETESSLSALRAQLAALQTSGLFALEPYVSVDQTTINGLAGPHVIFTGANLHVRSGSGSTEDLGVPLGLGNVVVGYNEGVMQPGERGGSHNLVIGLGHAFTSVGGFVAGVVNTITGAFASVSGGEGNTASEFASSVSGGTDNTASGDTASVSGGSGNTASGGASSVSGGRVNTASEFGSSVSGGRSRSVIGQFDWRAGELFQDF
jgi:hypothetical protein